MLKDIKHLSGWVMLVVARELWILLGKGIKMQRSICVNKTCQCDLDCDLKPTLQTDAKYEVMLL